MTAYPELYLHIAGERVERGARRGFAVLNPTTGETLTELPLADAVDLHRALDAAAQGFRLWRDSAPQQRAAVLHGASRLLHERADALAHVMTLEQGETPAAAPIEVMMVGVNTSMIGGADSPFGGVKWSGHGSEDGPEGLQACLAIKAVHEA